MTNRKNFLPSGGRITSAKNRAPKRTKVALAVACIAPFLAAGLISNAYAIPNGITSTVDEWLESNVEWIAESNAGFTVTGNVELTQDFGHTNNKPVLNAVYKDEYTDWNREEPINIVLTKDASLTLDDFLDIGLTLENGAKIDIRGEGNNTLTLRTGDTSEYKLQYGAAIWLYASELDNPSVLTIDGVNLNLMSSKGIRVDNDSEVKITDADYVYIGINEDKSSRYMNRGVEAVNGGSEIYIETKDFRIHSAGTQGWLGDKSTGYVEPSLIATGYIDNDSNFTNANEKEAFHEALYEKGPASVIIKANNFELQGFGGKYPQHSYAIYAWSGHLHDSYIDLSGDDFSLKSDWRYMIYSYAETGDSKIILNFANNIDISTTYSYAYGIFAWGFSGSTSEIYLTAGKDININSGNTGVELLDNAGTETVRLSAQNINIIAATCGIDNESDGEGPSDALLEAANDINIINSTAKASLIWAEDNNDTENKTVLKAGNNATLIGTGDGITAISEGTGIVTVSIEAQNDITFSSVKYAVQAETDNNGASYVTFTAGHDIKLTGEDLGIHSQAVGEGKSFVTLTTTSGDINLTTKDTAFKSESDGNGDSYITVTSGNNLNVITEAVGIYSDSEGTGDSFIDIEAANTVHIEAAYNAVEAYGINGGKSFATVHADNITVVPSPYDYTFSAVNFDGFSAASIDLKADSNLTVVSDDYSFITVARGTNAYVAMEAGTLTLAQTAGTLAEAAESGDIRFNFDKDAGTFAADKNTHLIGYVLAQQAGTVEIGLGTADSYFTGGANDYTGLNAITDIPDTAEEDTGTPYADGSGSSGSDSSSDSASGTDTASADDSGIATYSDTASSDTSDSTAASGEGTGETASSDADIAGAISIYAGNGAKWDVRLYNDISGDLLYSNIALYSSSGKDANGFSSYVDLTNETAGQNLFIEKLTGSDAQFILRTQVDESRYPTAQVDTYRDHVIIQEGHGDHYILVKTVGNSGVENDEDWVAEVQADYLIQHYEQNGAASVTLSMDENGNTVVTKPGVDGALSFTLANAHQAVDYNNRHYVLQTRDVKDADGNKIGTEWYLRYAGEIPDYTVVPPEEPSDFVLDQNFENLSNPAQLVTTLAGFGTMYSAWTANLTDLRKRLGEVRYGAQDGLWARGIWQKDTTDGLTGGKFEQKLKGIQIGADHIVTQNEDRMWLVGANFKYADGDQKVKGMDYGRGDMKTYGAFLYATYANYKGYYTDLVLSIDHYNEKMRAQQSDYTMTHGSYNTWGWGASVETGRMFSSTQSDEGWGPWYANWWVEPQLQLSYYWGKGKSFKLDNGMTVEQKNGQSLIGRAGVVIGKKYNYGKNRKEVSKKYSQFYVKGGVKQEFLGDQKLTVNGEKFSGNLRGPRVYYGAGMDWNLADNLRVYAQVEREQGSKYKRDYEVSVGLKWQF